MLDTVVVEVVQQGVPANRDRIARLVRGGFHRCAETLSPLGPHRDWERWS